MGDVLIAVALAVITSGSAYLGIRITIHPPSTEGARANYKGLFVLGSILSISLIGVQAWRNYAAGEKLGETLELQSGEIKNQGLDLKALREDNKRPIGFAVPPTKAQSTQRPLTEEERQAAKKAELKLKAAQLSAEILSYLAERNRSGMGDFRLNDLLKSPKSETPEEYKQRWDTEMKRCNDFRAETMTRYKAAFDSRAEALLREMLANRIDVQRAWYRPSSPESIQSFAMDLGSVAAQIR